MTKDKYRKWLYQELINAGAVGTYDIFLERLKEEDMRKTIYEYAHEHILTDDYSTFCKKLDGKYP